MKRMYDPTTIATVFIKAGLIAALAAVLLAPMTINATGADNASGADRAVADNLPLPPIPHLETMPWLTSAPAPRGFRIDTLMLPRFETTNPEVANAAAPGRPWLPTMTSPDIAGLSRKG